MSAGEGLSHEVLFLGQISHVKVVRLVTIAITSSAVGAVIVKWSLDYLLGVLESGLPLVDKQVFIYGLDVLNLVHHYLDALLIIIPVKVKLKLLLSGQLRRYEAVNRHSTHTI